MAANRLIHEKSPYLLQHAYNPVDWFPWGEEAFSHAHASEKPIFLSVGYSTCHWCHVMEHESFENETIAGILNAHFVCIKVDREERPDVDKIYMTALQAMGENGGWPMSMFLTPDLQPFFGGTYFPPESRYGKMGFPEMLTRIHDLWKGEREKVIESAFSITNYLKEFERRQEPGDVPEASALDACFRALEKSYDEVFGGFGGAPKFPRPVIFNFLFRYYHKTGSTTALDMAVNTLAEMWAGGMHDHLGGGFHRYSVDREWRVPHFEKMLYDQAQLVQSYLDAFQLTRDPLYESAATEILDYVLRDLTDPGGGFYSAEDADSERPEVSGEKAEGAFYAWSKKEIAESLGSDVDLFCQVYGVEEEGNVPFDPQHEFTGKNLLYRAQSVEGAAKSLEITLGVARQSLSRSRKTLWTMREKRPRPHRDDKILTAWNGLMIGAFARASHILGRPAYLLAAQRASEFVMGHLYSPETGLLLRRYRDGEAKHEALLDDYAFLAQGLLDLSEASLESRWLLRAIAITGTQMNLFWDEKGAGFFETSGKDPSLLVRMKELYDGAEPAGNSVAVMNLLRIAELTDNHGLREKALRTLAFFSATIAKQPVVLPQMLAALDFALDEPPQIVIVGHGEGSDTRALVNELCKRYVPNKVVLFVDGGEERAALSRLLPFVASLTMIAGKPTAYVCKGYVCALPTNDPAEFARQLDVQRL